jgi:dTMP kinase
MMAADRAEHVRLVVAPALSSGRWVVCDRFSASTLAYQGYGRGLALDDLRWLVAFATDGLECDLNVLVDIPVALAGERLGNAGSDRLESSGVGFYERVAIGYREMALADPAGWAVVDGTGSVEEVAGAIMSVVVERIGDPRGAASPGDADQELGGSL